MRDHNFDAFFFYAAKYYVQHVGRKKYKCPQTVRKELLFQQVLEL
jgi:hypothetical protein